MTIKLIYSILYHLLNSSPKLPIFPQSTPPLDFLIFVKGVSILPVTHIPNLRMNLDFSLFLTPNHQSVAKSCLPPQHLKSISSFPLIKLLPGAKMNKANLPST